MTEKIETIEQAEAFIKNLKRSENWVSNEELFTKLQRSEKLTEQHKRDDLQPYLGVNFCLYYIDVGEYNKAWEYTEKAKINARKFENDERLLDAISLQYRIQRYLGNLEKAQEIVNEQIDIAYKVNDLQQIASAYQNQAILFHRQRLKQDAIEAFEKAIRYITKSNNKYYISTFSIGYSGVLLDFNETELAEKNLKKGYNLAKENNYLSPLALAYCNLGLLYEHQKKEKKCIQSYKSCIRLFNEVNNTTDEITAKIMLSNAYVTFNRLEDAENLLKQTLDFSESNNVKYNLIGIYEALTSLLEKKENYKESLLYFKKLNKLKEEYLSNETDKRIRHLETTKRIDILKLEKESAEKMAEIKHDFLANMSHEIRTPINSILGICYLLQQQSLNNIQHDYVERLKRSGENLLGIINDVLDISKIESGKMELNHDVFSLDELINDVYTSLEPKSNAKELQFKVINNNADILLHGDKVRTYQVLLNIVSNAIKFTEKGSVMLSVKTETIDKLTKKITFTVTDTGIGINKKKINNIFDRYEQADETIKNKFGGTGLGLAISKKIIELMNGTISINSKLNNGSKFTITIPFQLADADNNDGLEHKISANLIDNKIILIADDNEENRLVLREILLSHNKTVRIMEACDGNDVIGMLFKRIPDVIFMDLDMPNLNGIETTQQIRRNRKYDNIKIIASTASLIALSEEELNEIGFNGLIRKPFKVTELLDKLSFENHNAKHQ